MYLFKRNSAGEMDPSDAGYKAANYTVRFELNGKQVLRSTKCNVLDEAKKIGNAIYDREVKRSLGLIVEAPKPVPAVKVPTIAQFTLCYYSAPTEAGKAARTEAVAVLHKMLRIANPELENVTTLPISAINDLLALAWFNYYLDINSRMEHHQVTQVHNRNTANSQFGKVYSMFHDGLLDHYRQIGMFSPTFAEFRAKGKARKFKKNVCKGIVAYNPPPQEVIDSMLASWLKLTDRNVFIATGFALVYGLRKSETQQVKWGWLRLLNGGCPALSNAAETAVVKAGNGILTTRALDPYYSQFIKRLDEMGWRGEADELVLQGGVAELESLCWDRLGKWLKSLSWTTDKMSHSLRAYAGSKVYMRYGLEAAKNYLRHAKSQTTEMHYCHFAKTWPMGDDERADMPERWAAKVATNIVPMAVAA